MEYINKLNFNYNTNDFINADLPRELVKGQKDKERFNIYFKDGEENLTNILWQVRVVFERPDGKTTNKLLAITEDDHFYITMGGWITDVAGILKISVEIKHDETIQTFGMAEIVIKESVEQSGETITDTQYQMLLQKIEELEIGVSGDHIWVGSEPPTDPIFNFWIDTIENVEHYYREVPAEPYSLEEEYEVEEEGNIYDDGNPFNDNGEYVGYEEEVEEENEEEILENEGDEEVESFEEY